MADSVIGVAYGSGPQTVDVSSLSELDELLDSVATQATAEQRPVAVTLYIPELGDDSPALHLGLGRDWSVLMYNDWHVQGTLDGGKASAWYFENDWSEAPPNHGIPVDDAREAAREFVRSHGQRPTNVEWVKD